MELGRGAKTVLLLAATIVVFAGLKLAASLLVPFFLAGFVATVTAPFVLWMTKHKVPAAAAVLLAILLDVAVLSGLGALVGQSVADFYAKVPGYRVALETALTDTTAFLAAYGVVQEELNKIVDPGSVVDMVATLMRSITGVISNFFLVLLIVIFMLFEAAGLRLKLESILGDRRVELDRMRAAMRQVSKYMVVKTATSAFTGLLVGVWVSLWGLDLPILWGLLAFMLNYVPTLGSIIAAIPPTTLAFVQLGPGPALGILAGYTVINVAIGTWMEPKIFGRAVGLSPLVVFLSMILWGWLLGPVGALLSVPLTLIVKIFLSNTNDFAWVSVLLAPAKDVEAGRPSLFPPRPGDPVEVRRARGAQEGPDEGEPAPMPPGE